MARTSKRVSKAKRVKASTTAGAKKVRKSSPNEKAKKAVKKAKAVTANKKRATLAEAHDLRLAASQTGSLSVNKLELYARSRGYTLGPSMAWFLDSTAKVAVRGVGDVVAFAAYRKLIDEMIENGDPVPSYLVGGIDEGAVFAALKRLCPLFPIC